MRQRYCSVIFFYRYISTSKSLKKVVPKVSSSSSSNEWLTRQLNDVYTKKARYENYRCRSAFKLLELDERFHFLRPGLSVVDCGAAPGSWTEAAVRKMLLNKKELLECMPNKGLVIAVDIQHMDPITGATVLKEMDFTKLETQEHIKSLLPNGEADLVMSDMAPNATGIKEMDAINITKLVYSALKFSLTVLRNDGTFLCKIWDSADVQKVSDHMKFLFKSVRRVKPKASYSNSSELFLYAQGFKRPVESTSHQ